jgi:hypothetical protein
MIDLHLYNASCYAHYRENVPKKHKDKELPAANRAPLENTSFAT